jgi:hypothetical protein
MAPTVANGVVYEKLIIEGNYIYCSCAATQIVSIVETLHPEDLLAVVTFVEVKRVFRVIPLGIDEVLNH